MHAHSDSGNALHGDSGQSDAVVGYTAAQGKSGVLGFAPNGSAVTGISDNATGVSGSGKNFGVVGTSTSGEGVHAHSDSGNAVHGDSAQSDAVVGLAAAQGKAGVLGLAPDGNAVAGISDNGTGVYGKGGAWAGYFDGKLGVKEDIILTNADCAEDFDVVVAERIEPGSVMVLGEEGLLVESGRAYDNRVAGVISGAGDYKPGIVLDKKQGFAGRLPVALIGKVYCKVDAEGAPVAVGDLLTTSPTLGHAMKAADPARAFGSVIGKALRPLKAGRGLIPILVALQ
ncbi:MAG: hypothetical protein JO076_06980 [Verrucomicrobia bacterium]|nr:hypothetical protein [Verrucomicrobiota bacterium]